MSRAWSSAALVLLRGSQTTAPAHASRLALLACIKLSALGLDPPPAENCRVLLTRPSANRCRAFGKALGRPSARPLAGLRQALPFGRPLAGLRQALPFGRPLAGLRQALPFGRPLARPLAGPSNLFDKRLTSLRLSFDNMWQAWDDNFVSCLAPIWEQETGLHPSLTLIRACTHALLYRAYTHTCAYSCTPTHAATCTHARTRARTCTCAHARTNRCTHAHMHMHACMGAHAYTH